MKKRILSHFVYIRRSSTDLQLPFFTTNKQKDTFWYKNTRAPVFALHDIQKVDFLCEIKYSVEISEDETAWFSPKGELIVASVTDANKNRRIIIDNTKKEYKDSLNIFLNPNSNVVHISEFIKEYKLKP